MDSIQHAYGWTDEQVLDLTLRRAIHIRDSIRQREEVRTWEHQKALEWQTKNLASIIANTVDSKEARKALNEVVDNMSITGTPASDKPKKRKPTKRPTTYKLKTGEEIPASEIGKYRYDEIDHTEEDQARMDEARARNRGKNVMGVFNPPAK